MYLYPLKKFGNFNFFFYRNSVFFYKYLFSSYYTNWSQYRSERGYGFYPEDIDASLCTHIIYAFGKIEDDTIVNFEDNDVSIGIYIYILIDI